MQGGRGCKEQKAVQGVKGVTHREGGEAEGGRGAAGGVDNGQVVERGQCCERAVVGNDERSADGLQHGHVQLGQARVLADLRAHIPRSCVSDWAPL